MPDPQGSVRPRHGRPLHRTVSSFSLGLQLTTPSFLPGRRPEAPRRDSKGKRKTAKNK